MRSGSGCWSRRSLRRSRSSDWFGSSQCRWFRRCRCRRRGAWRCRLCRCGRRITGRFRRSRGLWRRRTFRFDTPFPAWPVVHISRDQGFRFPLLFEVGRSLVRRFRLTYHAVERIDLRGDRNLLAVPAQIERDRIPAVWTKEDVNRAHIFERRYRHTTPLEKKRTMPQDAGARQVFRAQHRCAGDSPTSAPTDDHTGCECAHYRAHHHKHDRATPDRPGRLGRAARCVAQTADRSWRAT